jgi:signal peptidase I
MEDSNMEGSRPRRPLYALLLTFGATGLGHIYCGRLVKGLVLFFITFLFTPVIVFSAKYVSSIFTLILLLASILITFLVFLYALIDSCLLAKRIGERFKIMAYNKWYIYLLFILVSFSHPISREIVIRDHFLQAFKTPAGSMLPSILVNDHILLNKSIYLRQTPQIGDIVIFIYPNDRSKDFIKRIVALPGDSVEMKNSVLYINDIALNYPEIDPQDLSEIKGQVKGKVFRETNGGVSYKIMLIDAPPQNYPRTIVPDGHCFVLGDNRNNSLDSRHFGPVPLTDVKGRVDYIYFPAESWSRFGRYRD